MNRRGLLLFFAGGCFAAIYAQTRVSMSEPHLSPDRGEVAFVSGGDIWRAPITGGEAALLVSHPADESRPLYSPDGTRLAFVSTRTGDGDIYVLTLASGDLKRITFGDGLEQLDAWSRDGKWLYYHSSSGDISQMQDVYRISASGGPPIPIAADRYASEFFAAPSPDGKIIAINARGIASRQWWRHGHSHLDTSEIYLVRPGPVPNYERISDGGAKEIWPMWANDAKSIFFISDRTGVENIWRQPLGGTSKQVSLFKDGRVLWPTISYDGRWIVFERDFGIWRMDTTNGKATPIAIHLRGVVSGPAITHRTFTTGFDELALSPDGKKLAFTVHGEVFATAKAGGDGQRISNTPALESEIAWSPDSRKLVYTSDRSGSFQVILYDFGDQKESVLTAGEDSSSCPRFSPDGKMIAYLRGGKAVWIYDVDKKQERQLAAGDFGRPPLLPRKSLAWSHDSRWLAFASSGTKGFTNVLVVRAAGGAAQPVSFLANSSVRAIQWSPDGKFLLFETSQRTEESRIARVDLTPRTPGLREDQFRDLFRTPGGDQEQESTEGKPSAGAKKPVKPVEIVFDGIRHRLSLLPLGIDVEDFEISSDGKFLLISGRGAGEENLFTYSLEENRKQEPAPRQITSTSGRKAWPQIAPGDKEVFYRERGVFKASTLETRVSRNVNLTAELDIDFNQEKREVFQQAWTYQRDNFFDEKFNGADWNALKKQYEPLVAGSRTPAELQRVINLMLGELNASHSGIGPEIDRDRPSTVGHLGLRFDPQVLEKGQFKISESVTLGPAAIAGIKGGEFLVAIDGVDLNGQTNLQELLQNKTDKRVELKVAADSAGAQSRVVALAPVSSRVEKNLFYRAWVESRRSYVEKASGGKLGYVHMPDMSAESLAQLNIDLDVENHGKEGVVVDIRNNNGGFVNAYALDVFSRRPYLTFLERGRPATPARSRLGQRALELPTILVTNQHSLSDAEDFSEGYRRLKLGKVVGEPTAGWIVYTWGERLIDGSSLRMPRVKVFDNDGMLMEMHPRPVDVPVQRPIGESYTGKDIQLDTAVKELLQQLDTGRSRPTQ